MAQVPKPETVHGRDERVQVETMTSPPYNWICYLSITGDQVWQKWLGSGFKIHLPDVNRTAIVTSGHCIYSHKTGAYFPKITVWFPEHQPIAVGPSDMYAPPQYIFQGSPDHDYGLIILPPDSDNEGFGWTAIIPDDKLKNRLVTNCGFPGDKPDKTMWITGGEITKFTKHRIFYENDTFEGQSGSPVYTWYDGYWTVIGVHSYGGVPNSAPRITHQMISRFLHFIGGLKAKILKSVKFPGFFLSCNGKRVSCENTTTPQSDNKFYIYPVEMPPSLALETDVIRKVVIESKKYKLTYIRMEAKDMRKFDHSGGGEVMCHFTASSWESYFLKEEDGKFSFRNVRFPNCYIRADGGSGKVNCQYYEDKQPPSPWEWFYIEESY